MHMPVRIALLSIALSISVTSCSYIPSADGFYTKIESEVLERNANAIDRARRSHGIVVIAFDVDSENDPWSLTDYFSMKLLIDKQLWPNSDSAHLVDSASFDFRKKEDNEKFYYFKLVPGNYKISVLSGELTSFHLNQLNLKDADMHPHVSELITIDDETTWFDPNLSLRDSSLKPVDYVRILSGDIIYVGTYKLTISRIPRDSDIYQSKYTYTSINIEDNFDLAQQDLLKITGNKKLKMIKKLNLLNDFSKLKLRFF